MNRKKAILLSTGIVAGTVFSFAGIASAHAATVNCATSTNDFSTPATIHWIGSSGKENGTTVIPAAPSSDKPVKVLSKVAFDTVGWFATWGDGFRFPPGTELINIYCGPSEVTTTTSTVAPTTTAVATSVAVTTTTTPFVTTIRPRASTTQATAPETAVSVTGSVITLPVTGSSTATETAKIGGLFGLLGGLLVFGARRRHAR